MLAKRTTIDHKSNTYYYHKDHLGSTRSVTDSNKTVISTLTYHPFGEIDNEEGSEQYLYTGKERDSIGLYYYGARYYGPDIGKFITRDPLKGKIIKPQSLNRYTYCFNNPLKFKDFWGLFTYPDEINPDEYEFVGKPGNSIFWEGEWYILITPLIKVNGSRIAVAVAYRRVLNHSPHRIYGREEGILIIIYNDNGEIIDVLFFPFDMLETKRGRRKAWKKMCDTLRKHNIDYNDLFEALNVFYWLMNEKSDDMGLISGGFLSGAAFLTFFVTCPPIAGGAGLLALNTYIESYIWDNWSEIILLLSQGHKYYK